MRWRAGDSGRNTRTASRVGAASLSMQRGPRTRPSCGIERSTRSGLLDLLQHLEDALGRADEHALERLRQATALECVAAGAAAFSHGASLLGGPAEPEKTEIIALPT